MSLKMSLSVSLSVFMDQCMHVFVSASHATLTSAFLGTYPVHYLTYIWAQKGGWLQNGPYIGAGLT